MAVLVVNVKEEKEKAAQWAKKVGYTLPILRDTDGKVAASYAPKEVLPEMPRDEITVASNIIIDREGRIQFFELLDTRNFDAKLVHLKKRLEALRAAE